MQHSTKIQHTGNLEYTQYIGDHANSFHIHILLGSCGLVFGWLLLVRLAFAVEVVDKVL